MFSNKNVLKQIGGIDSNSFINTIDPDTDENDAMNQPQVICHSPYQDFDKLKSTLKNSKIQFIIFSTNTQSVRAMIDECRQSYKY